MNRLKTALLTVFLSITLSPAKAAEINGELQKTIQMLDAFHYRKIAFDEQVIDSVKSDFISMLDPDKTIFTHDDVDTLMKSALNLEPADNNLNLRFYSEKKKT